MSLSYCSREKELSYMDTSNPSGWHNFVKLVRTKARFIWLDCIFKRTTYSMFWLNILRPKLNMHPKYDSRNKNCSISVTIAAYFGRVKWERICPLPGYTEIRVDSLFFCPLNYTHLLISFYYTIPYPLWNFNHKQTSSRSSYEFVVCTFLPY